MRSRTRRRAASRVAVRAILAIGSALGISSSPSPALNEGWTLALEPIFMDAYGHDQHVLTIHHIDLGSTPTRDDRSAVRLDTDGGLAYRGKVDFRGARWGWGLDFLWFNGSQDAADRTAAASGPGGALDQVAFEVADRTFTSSAPGQVLFYGVLEDTDLAIWTLDLYGTRILAETRESRLHLLFGLRNADFDNDYRAVVGVQGVAGSRLDASSNYERMMGPLVGLTGELRRGRSTIQGHLAQSVVFGEAELSGSSREFTGPFGEVPSFFAEETFSSIADIAIPITELRIQWTYAVARWVSLGLGVDTSAWWDVSVPPGVVPAEGGDATLHENTIVFSGALAAVKLTF